MKKLSLLLLSLALMQEACSLEKREEEKIYEDFPREKREREESDEVAEQLITAIARNNLGKVRSLLNTINRASFEYVDTNGDSVLDRAIRERLGVDLIKLMLSKGALVTDHTISVAEESAFAGEEEIIDFLKSTALRQKQNKVLDKVAAENGILLIGFIREGTDESFASAKKFIENTALVDLNAAFGGRSVLDWAVVVQAPLEFVDLLRFHGAVPTEATIDLVSSIKNKEYQKKVRDIVVNGSLLKRRAADLMNLIKAGKYTEALKYLNDNSSNAFDRAYEDSDGRTIISIIAGSGAVGSARQAAFALFKALLENGFDYNTPSPKILRTPLMYAIVNGYEEVVQLLLDRGVNTAIKDADGNTALMIAAQYLTPLRPGQVGISELIRIRIFSNILKKSKDVVSAVNRAGESALELAIKAGNVGAVTGLLRNGAKINAREIEAADKQKGPNADKIVDLLSGGAAKESTVETTLYELKESLEELRMQLFVRRA